MHLCGCEFPGLWPFVPAAPTRSHTASHRLAHEEKWDLETEGQGTGRAAECPPSREVVGASVGLAVGLKSRVGFHKPSQGTHPKWP